MKHLVLGGVKSGKSLFAEQCAQAISDQVAIVVTAEPIDDEMVERIAKHQVQRPAAWRVVEAPVELAAAIRTLDKDASVEVILVDCLTLWLTNLLVKPEVNSSEQIDALLASVKACETPLILVGNESNMGLIGAEQLSRRYADLAGRLHQQLASIATRVDLMVAGLPLSLKASGRDT